MNDILQCRDVSCILTQASGSFKLLENVNLNVERGDVISIAGKSGSGKSTLLHILSSLKVPTKGEVRINDKDIYSLSERQVAKLRSETIGFVFQSFNLIAELNAYENIILPLKIVKKDRSYTEELISLAHRIGVGNILQSKISQISGGEKARIAILRALACKPDIVFLDEPTGALDTATAALIEDLILELSGDFSTSFIYVTHDVEFAKRAKKRYEIRDRGLYRV